MEVLLIAFLLILIFQTGELFSCSPSELEKCLGVLQSVTGSDDLALATTRHELEQVCRKLKRGVRCVDDHSSRCFSTSQLRVYDSVVSETRQVIDDICVEGELQEDYLNHAPCFKNISTDSNKCAPKYRKVAILSQDLTEEDKDSFLESVCCALRDFFDCKHEYAMRDCAPGASQFLQRHMDRMSGSLLNEHCVLYTYGPSSCSTNISNSVVMSKGITQKTILFVLVVYILYLFILIKRN